MLQFVSIAFHSVTAGSHLTCCPPGPPKLLSIQAAPSRTIGWGYSISDAGRKLRAKWRKSQDIKDNDHKWLNGVQGGKVIIKHSLHWIPTFLQQLFGSSVLCNLGCRCRMGEASEYHLSDVAWHPSNKSQFIVQLCHSLLLLCFCMGNSWLLSCL